MLCVRSMYGPQAELKVDDARHAVEVLRAKLAATLRAERERKADLEEMTAKRVELRRLTAHLPTELTTMDMLIIPERGQPNIFFQHGCAPCDAALPLRTNAIGFRQLPSEVRFYVRLKHHHMPPPAGSSMSKLPDPKFLLTAKVVDGHEEAGPVAHVPFDVDHVIGLKPHMMLSPYQLVLEVPSTSKINPDVLPTSIAFHPRHHGQLHTISRSSPKQSTLRQPSSSEIVLPRVIVPLFPRPQPTAYAQLARPPPASDVAGAEGYVRRRGAAYDAARKRLLQEPPARRLMAFESKDDVAAHLVHVLHGSLGRARELFAEWDPTGKGRISKDELRDALLALTAKDGHIDPSVIDELCDRFDVDGSESIAYRELEHELEHFTPAVPTRWQPREQAAAQADDGEGTTDGNRAGGEGDGGSRGATKGIGATAAPPLGPSTPPSKKTVAALRAEHRLAAERRMAARQAERDARRAAADEREAQRIAAALAARASGETLPEGVHFTLKGVDGAEGKPVTLHNLRMGFTSKQDVAELEKIVARLQDMALKSEARRSLGGSPSPADGTDADNRSAGGDTSLGAAKASRRPPPSSPRSDSPRRRALAVPKKAGDTARARAVGALHIREQRIQRLEAQQQAALEPTPDHLLGVEALVERFLDGAQLLHTGQRPGQTPPLGATVPRSVVPDVILGTPYEGADEAKRLLGGRSPVPHGRGGELGSAEGRRQQSGAGAGSEEGDAVLDPLYSEPIWPRLEASLSPRLHGEPTNLSPPAIRVGSARGGGTLSEMRGVDIQLAHQLTQMGASTHAATSGARVGEPDTRRVAAEEEHATPALQRHDRHGVFGNSLKRSTLGSASSHSRRSRSTPVRI